MGPSGFIRAFATKATEYFLVDGINLVRRLPNKGYQMKNFNTMQWMDASSMSFKISTDGVKINEEQFERLVNLYFKNREEKPTSDHN